MPTIRTKYISAVLAVLCLSAGAPALARQDDSKSGSNGVAYLVANAHLDTQWNWTVRTTIREYLLSTVTQNLWLLDTYPDYVFNFEGAQRYSWIKEYYPELFARVKEYAALGRWHVAGSSWDANETVICSPESFIRNITLGQTWFREELGVEGTDVFLPDCFGFSYDLPTLAAHCGLIGFSSQKLGWRINPFYEDGTNRGRVPFNVGVWQGIDGSRIMFAHGFGYGTEWKESRDLANGGGMQRLIAQSKGVGAVYHYYGVGDKGGSPTVGSVAAVQRSVHEDGKVRIVSAESDRMYKDFQPLSAHPELPVYDGELLMDAHGNGCYTSQAAMKLYNRQNETLGDAAERLSCAAEWMGAARYPSSAMTESWRRMIWHQFHDDLTGTSIPEAYAISWNDELLSLKQFSQTLTNAVSGIVSRMDTRVKGVPVVVCNSRAAGCVGIADVRLESDAPAAVYDPTGRKTLSQVVERRDGRHLLFDTRFDGAGLGVYSLRGRASSDRRGTGERAVKSFGNSVYTVTFDEAGDICSLVDKRSGKELVASGQAVGLVMFSPSRSEVWPAWEITWKTIQSEPVRITDDVEVVLVEDGPLCRTVRVSKRFGESRIVQYVTLYEGSCADRVDFRCEVDWRSADALLKADFPLGVSNPFATYDIGLGSVRRDGNTPNKYEVYAHEWADLTDADGSYGVTVMNFSKYGWDKPADNRLRLSLLYSPSTNELTYPYQTYQDFGWHTFTYSIRGHAGGLDRAEVSKAADAFNNPPLAFCVDGKHEGSLGRKYTFLSSDNGAVRVSALKKAEASDCYVVRVFETGGESVQRARLTFAHPIAAAWTADGTEVRTGEAAFSGSSLDVEAGPFGVRTYLLSFDVPECAVPDAVQLDLPYDRRCFSFNGMRSAADFSAGYSYAAELLPDGGIDVDGVNFRLGDKTGKNGLVCKGDTLWIPQGYGRLCLLAAAADGDVQTALNVNGTRVPVTVPYYSGFAGQWEHYGQTDGYLKDAAVAYVGTHRHSVRGDEPYVFTYMWRIEADVPERGGYVVLPEREDVIVFAASAVRGESRARPAARLFETSNKSDVPPVRDNLLSGAAVTGTSGIVIGQADKSFVEDNMATLWNDPDSEPHWIEFDLGEPRLVSGWKMVSASDIQSRFMVRDCILEGKADGETEWRVIDMVEDNTERVLDRRVRPVELRHVRLQVNSPRKSIYCRQLPLSGLELY